MPRMTEEEANALDELLTKTTPKVNPAIKGITAQKGFKMLSVDNFSAEYIISKALATKQTPEEVIHEMVARELAAVI